MNIIPLQAKRDLNEGHGHVFTRPDGVRMRCGGPSICQSCRADREKLRQLWTYKGRTDMSIDSILEEIAAERASQVVDHGFDAAHDAKYLHRELERAAAGYCLYAAGEYEDHKVPGCWPWHRNWWKPRNHRRSLIKAGALIVAAIDRLDRSRKEQ